MNKYVYITIRSKNSSIIRDKEDRDQIKKIITKYPIIGEIIGIAYKIITKKPILTRMGKGKGKIVGKCRPVEKGGIILEGYIPKRRIKYIIYRMKKEGVYNSNSNISVTLFQLL